MILLAEPRCCINFFSLPKGTSHRIVCLETVVAIKLMECVDDITIEEPEHKFSVFPFFPRFVGLKGSFLLLS